MRPISIMNLDRNKSGTDYGSYLSILRMHLSILHPTQGSLLFFVIRSTPCIYSTYQCKQNGPIIPPDILHNPKPYRKPHSHHDNGEAYEYMIGGIDAGTMIDITNCWRSRRRWIHGNKNMRTRAMSWAIRKICLYNSRLTFNSPYKNEIHIYTYPHLLRRH